MNTSKIRFIRALRTTFCTALSLGLGACVGGEGETMTASGATTTSGGSTSGSTGESEGTSGTSGTSGTTGTSGSGSASDSATTGESSTTGVSSTTGESSTTGDTSTTGSTTGGGGSFQGSCEDACATFYGCMPDAYESLEACILECLDGLPQDANAQCEAAYVSVNECVAGSSCMELEGDFCSAEVGQIFALCDLEQCDVTAGGGADECSIAEICGDLSQEMICSGKTCQCIEDGSDVGSCDNDVCVDGVEFDTLAEKAFSCCGFEF